MKSIVDLVTEFVHIISSADRGLGFILIAALRGASIFVYNLVRQNSIPVKIDFRRAASYGSNTK